MSHIGIISLTSIAIGDRVPFVDKANKVRLIEKRSTQGRLKHSLYVGLQSRVARTLGISRSVVCQVMNGTRTSKRVAAALEKEFSRIEREIARDLERAA